MRETRPVIVIGDACVDVTVRLADLMVGHSDVYDSERLLPLSLIHISEPTRP